MPPVWKHLESSSCSYIPHLAEWHRGQMSTKSFIPRLPEREFGLDLPLWLHNNRPAKFSKEDSPQESIITCSYNDNTNISITPILCLPGLHTLLRFLLHPFIMRLSLRSIIAAPLLYTAAIANPTHHPTQNRLDAFIKAERAIALQGALNNIGPNGSAVPGAGAGYVVASPSKVNPNCRSQWALNASPTFIFG
jgi:hypothetical protein